MESNVSQKTTKQTAGQNTPLSAWSRSFRLGCVFQRVMNIKPSGIMRNMNIPSTFFTFHLGGMA